MLPMVDLVADLLLSIANTLCFLIPCYEQKSKRKIFQSLNFHFLGQTYTLTIQKQGAYQSEIFCFQHGSVTQMINILINKRYSL